MSNEIAKKTDSALNVSDDQMMAVLESSLYPGASRESIKLVLSYCQASGLDPMQKPVHIVPMDVAVKSNDGKITYQKRDVIMPGIGLYRIQAARTSEYAGVTEPVFGEIKKIATQRKQYNNASRDDKSFTMVNDGEIEFPEWCKVTVKRLVGGMAVEFTAKEYWQENYATAGKDSTAPNAMWKRRPYAQLAKCAEAQALRKAFPELGAAPTADEMEGKEFFEKEINPIHAAQPVQLEEYPANRFSAKFPDFEASIISGEKTADDVIGMVSTRYAMTEDQKNKIKAVKKAEYTNEQFVADMEKGDE